MALLEFQRRWTENVSGPFYVGNQCVDCDLCRSIASSVFGRNELRGYSYVKKQPATEEELAAAKKAVWGCCVETIRDDGMSFDWDAIPAEPDLDYPKEEKEALPSRSPLRAWWQFWR